MFSPCQQLGFSPAFIRHAVGHLLVVPLMLFAVIAIGGDFSAAVGPLAHEFRLTLEPGHRFEALGPLYFDEEAGPRKSLGVPPLFSWTKNPDVASVEFDLLYPLLTLDRYGSEYRWQLFQLLAFAGGKTQEEKNQDRFTIFPFWFQQRSKDTNLNYTALLPLYGHLRNRFFRDEVSFVLLPLYVQTRKKDVVTDNYVYPFFHLRRGDGLAGWQFWPLLGNEHKAVTVRTNGFGDTEVVGGHEKFFALWPFFLNHRTGLGTENPEHNITSLPLFNVQRSPARDSTTFLWPFFNAIDDHAHKYREWDFPWPFFEVARGEGKTGARFWPLFSHMHNDHLVSDFYLWPLYKYNRATSPPLERARTRILFFLYSDVSEKDLDTGKRLHRVDFWPLFTSRSGRDGRERLQILAPIEPFLPTSKSVDRNWSPLWSLWRSEKNAATGARSQSLLWNLYRHDATPESKKCSLLFGLFQYQTTPGGTGWRLFYIPLGKSGKTADPSPKP